MHQIWISHSLVVSPPILSDLNQLAPNHIVWLKPNFGDLTVTEMKTEKVKDAHSLVSIKAGIKGRKSSEPEKKTEISPKIKEESREA